MRTWRPRWRPRITLRWMMIGVAIVAFALMSWRQWGQWRRILRNNPNTFMHTSYVVASVKPGHRTTPLVGGDEVPISIEYSYAFNPPAPPPGFVFCLRAEAWVEDVPTGSVVDHISFERYLVSGVHDKACGTETWVARPPGIGHYFLHSALSYTVPLGQFPGRRPRNLGRWQFPSGSGGPLYQDHNPPLLTPRTPRRRNLPPSMRPPSAK